MSSNIVRYVLDVVGQGATKSLKAVDKASDKVAQGMDKVGRATKKSGKALKTMSKAGKAAASGLAAIGAALVAGAGAMVAFGQQQADVINDLNDLSTRSGMAATSIQALQFAFVASGQSAETVQQLVDKMPKLMSELARETGKSADAAKKLGVEAFDPLTGKLRDSQDVFIDLTRELQKIESGTERATLAADLFGRQAGNMMQAFGQTEGLETFLDFTNKWGVDVGPEATKQAAQFQQAVSILRTVTQRLGQSVSKVFGEEGFVKPLKFAAVQIIGLGALIEDLVVTLPSMLTFFSRPFILAFKEIKLEFMLMVDEMIMDLNRFPALAESMGVGITSGLATSIIKGIGPLEEEIEDLKKPLDLDVQWDHGRRMAEFAKDMDQLLADIESGLESSGSVIIDPIEETLSVTKGTIDDLIQSFHDVFDDIADPLEDWASSMVQMFNEKMQTIGSVISNIGSGDIVGASLDVVKHIADKMGDEFTRAMMGVAEQAVHALSNFGNIQMQAADQLAQKMIEDRRESLQKRVESGEITQGQADQMLDQATPGIEARAEEEAMQRRLGQEQIKQNMTNRIKALTLGLKMLPGILLEVLPVVLAKFVGEMILAILSLPGKIFESLKSLFKDVVDAIRFEKVREGARSAASTIGEAIVSPFMASGGRFLPSAASGMRFTGNDFSGGGLAMLHENEFVVPQSGGMPQSVSRQFEGSRGIVINVNADIVERSAIDALVRRIEQQFNRFGSATSPIFNQG